ncbi:MAG: SH3 domain-containing protein [Alphaproteobacteria bacterium]|nr:SH3 domain-containing protein [Alphaproteobacteria bacterium]
MKNTILPLLVCSFLLAFPVAAAEDADNTTRLPIPRFAALRSNEVNMRAGPGLRYPIEWVFSRRGLPVEITAEYDVWRRVRDPDGAEGWISRIELTGRRGALVTSPRCSLKKKRNELSETLAHLEAGAVGQIVSCERIWCKVKFDGMKGYLRKTDFWGAYPEEIFD